MIWERHTGFRDEIVLGDLAFEATGDSVSELFAAAALAVIEAMVDPLSVETSWTQEVRLSEAEIEDLLFEWFERHRVYQGYGRGCVS